MSDLPRTPSTGGLVTPSTLGVSRSELGDIMDRFDTHKFVEEDLGRMGIRNTDKPEFELPAITAEVLNSTDNQYYSTIYAQQLAWFNYLSPILAQVKAGLLQSENQKDLIEAKIKERARKQNKVAAKEDKLTEDGIKTEVKNDPTYQEALLESQRAEQFKIRLEAQVDIAERNMRVISRQVEIRRLEIEGHGRESSMPYRGNFGNPGPVKTRR